MRKLVFFSLLLLGVTLVRGETTAPTGPTGPTTNNQPTTGSPATTTNRTRNTYSYITGNDTTCLIVTLKAYFNESGRVVNVSGDAEAVKSQSSCEKMTVMFGDNYTFTLTFQNNSKMYWLHQIDANLGSTNGNVSDLSIGNSTLKASYQCNAGFQATLSNNITLFATDVQFQAIEVPNNKYGTAQICTADIGNNIVIPIAVGCALAGLIIIVVIAYLIGRKQVKHRYEAM